MTQDDALVGTSGMLHSRAAARGVKSVVEVPERARLDGAEGDPRRFVGLTEIDAGPAPGPGDGPPEAPPKPGALRPDFERIPDELRKHARWVLWRLEWSAAQKKWTKVPYRASGHGKASSTNPDTWATFEAARDAYGRHVRQADGVGWVIGEGIVGGDVDECRDEHGTLTAEAAAIITEVNTYAEVSPSGTGVRYFAAGTLPPEGRKRGAYEMYDGDGGRYLTVTGHQLDGTPVTIESRDDVLAAIHARHIAPKPKPSNGEHHGRVPIAAGHGAHLSDDDVLDRMKRARPGTAALYDGDISAYGDDHSAADLALCSYLAWWTDYDAAQVDRLFRSSRLMRPKWDRPARHGETYGEGTIRRAFEGRGPGDGYHPGTEPAPVGRDPSDPGPSDDNAPPEVRASTVVASPDEVPAATSKAKPSKALPRSAEAKSTRVPNLVQLSTVEREEVERLDAEGRLLIGKTAIMYGDPGVGKTFISLSIAANITRGRPAIPLTVSPGSIARTPANVLALIGEDGLADTIRARFDDADGDATRFYVMRGILETNVDTGETHEREVNLLKLDEVEAAVIKVKPLLVIIDPLTHFLGAGTDTNMGVQVRANMKGIGKLAERFGFALLILHHMNKGSGKAIYRGVGSIDFSAYARSVLVAGEYEGQPSLAHSKVSIASKAPTLTFRITAGRLDWTGVSRATADDITGPPPTRRQAPVRVDAADWLRAKLTDGPRSATEMRTLVEDNNVGSWRTIQAAKKDLWQIGLVGCGSPCWW